MANQIDDQNNVSVSDEDFLDSFDINEMNDLYEASDEDEVEEGTDIEEEETTPEEAPEEDQESEEDEPQDEDSPESEDDEVESDEADTEEDEDSSSYETELAALKEVMTKGFRANGRDVTIDSVEDMVELSKKGLNYLQKMNKIKPHLKTTQMLEKHGLLDESKLSFLIDVQNGNKDAILKLIKDNNIDPLEIDLDSDSNYVTEDKSVSDSEFELRSAFSDIETSSKYDETVTAINNLDVTSRQEIVANPQLVSVLNNHIETGVYSNIMNEIERRQLLGKLDTSEPMLQLYKTVGDELYLANSNTQEDKAVVKKPVKVNKPSSPAKKAATKKPTGKKVKTTSVDDDVWSGSDEAFMARMSEAGLLN